MITLSRHELMRLNNAAGVQARTLRSVDTPSARTIELELNAITNKVREALTESELTGRAVIEVKA